MSDRERVAQVAHQKWANEGIAHFLERIVHSLIFLQKKSDLLRKLMSEFPAITPNKLHAASTKCVSVSLSEINETLTNLNFFGLHVVYCRMDGKNWSSRKIFCTNAPSKGEILCWVIKYCNNYLTQVRTRDLFCPRVLVRYRWTVIVKDAMVR